MPKRTSYSVWWWVGAVLLGLSLLVGFYKGFMREYRAEQLRQAKVPEAELLRHARQGLGPGNRDEQIERWAGLLLEEDRKQGTVRGEGSLEEYRRYSESMVVMLEFLGLCAQDIGAEALGRGLPEQELGSFARSVGEEVGMHPKFQEAVYSEPLSRPEVLALATPIAERRLRAKGL